MKLLIISDLHIGLKARAKELCPYPDGEYKDSQLVTAFIECANEYQDINGKFDYFVIPGDITHQSNLIEYAYGEKFINRVITELGLSRQKIIFVPGNHDVDWSVIHGDTIHEVERPYRMRHKYNTLKDTDHIFSELASNELTESPFVKKWEFDDVVFFGFNSSWDDGPTQRIHHGQIGLDQIDILRREIENTDLRNKLKIFVVHHHVFQYANPHPSWTDTSIMQNSQPLIEMLAEFSFNFIIHGHRHVPNFVSLNLNQSETINILCSGSYSCEVPTDIAGTISNLFHIIEIDDLTNCKGRVKSLAYNTTKYKWVESKDNNGIEYENAFGITTDYNSLLGQCINVIQTELQINPYIDYKELVLQIPDLTYASNNVRDKLVSNIEEVLNLRRSSTVFDQNMIFVRRKP